MHIEYLNFPKIPSNLLHNVSEIIALNRKQSIRHDAIHMYYQTKMPKQELVKWVQNLFDFPIHCSYQIIFPGIPIHKDRDRKIAYNYLLDQGGENVRTVVYDENKIITNDEIIPLHVWHKINVSKYHAVYGIDTSKLRVAITVEPERN